MVRPRASRPLTVIVGSCAAAVAAIWNPWVGERLLMGHWALLMGYAACPWVLLGLARRVSGERRWLGAALAMVLGSLGGASAQMLIGVCLLGMAIAVVVTRRFGSARHTRRMLPPLALCAVMTLPWAVPALLARVRSSDARAFGVFVPRGDTPLGTVISVLSGSGGWNAAAVVPGRDTLIGGVGAILVLGGALLGLARGLARAPAVGDEEASPDVRSGALAARGVICAGVLGLLLTSGGFLLARSPELAQALAALPGGGLFRDSGRQLGPWMLALALGLGVVAASATTRQWTGLGVILGILPVAALPLLAFGVRGALEPVRYPDSVLTAAAVVNAQPGDWRGADPAVALQSRLCMERRPPEPHALVQTRGPRGRGALGSHGCHA